MEVWELIERYLGREMVNLLVPGRILAVDDDPGNLVVLEELLAEDFEVVSTESPAEALRLARETEFDMVISDQRMPGVTGVELLRQVRETYPRTVRVIISAYSDAPAMLDAINVGEVFRFILKPWEPEHVLSVVEMGLEHRLTHLAIRRLVQVIHAKNKTLEETLAELRHTQDRLLQTAKLATVGQLTASIVRELKNHVTGVQLLAEAVEAAGVPEELAEHVRVGSLSAQSLFDLISGLNAFATKDAWKLRRTRVSLNGVLAQALRVAKLDPRAADRLIDFVPARDLPDVALDREKMRQVAVNLLLNALEATSRGERIEVRSLRDHVGGQVLFRVADGGAGMPRELVARALDPFTSRSEGGLGLGLEVCRRVVEAHGGGLKIESKEGRGTSVVVSIPIEPPATQPEN
jgi:signal transduction histidine kinase